MIDRLIEFGARNRFLTILATLLASAVAVYALLNTPLDAIPDLSDTQVIIQTEWKGRSPDLIEDQITYPLVTAMVAAPKSKAVRGLSMFGQSFVYVIFKDGTDLYWARSRVLEYLSKIKGQLPRGVNPILGPDATGVGWAYQYALVDKSGRNDLAQLRTYQDWYLRYKLEELEGVAEVASVGGFVKQYQIQLDPNKLRSFNLPVKKVIQAVRRSNNDVGGRVVEMTGREYFVRGRGYIKNLEDLRSVVVKVGRKGVPVLLRDVARVRFGPEMRRGAADLNGEGEVVGGIVVVRFGENVLKVIKRVKKRLEKVKKQGLPKGMEIVEVYDRSELINRSIDNLKETLLAELVVVSLIIFLFLLHIQSTLIAIITLPIAVLLAFIPMYFLNLSSNIMSLGGIAIAIGTMVDAAIVLVENAHKRLEQAPPDANRLEVIISATKEVGRPIFFALLIITVSFLPVFALEDREGRLFKPLAFTKTFSMFFGAFLAVTLIPALLALLVRGKIHKEEKNPLNRILIALYRPVGRFVLRFRALTIAVALGVVAAAVPVFLSLKSEFMPPLKEGSILYMPTTVPGISIEQARELLQKQDRIFKAFPEVKSVFGKIGRARTSTDPAPLSMVETTIMLHPKSKWRKDMTWKKLIHAMERAVKMPGVSPGSYEGPIITRIEMLSTGFRTPLGIKVFGTDLKRINHISKMVESALGKVKGTKSIFADRIIGGYFIDFKPRRAAAARHGLNVEDVAEIVETAIGGMNIDTTVEGRERYKINVRYAQDYRKDLDTLKEVLVATPTGIHVPMAALADIKVASGAPMIKNENGSKVGYVTVVVDEEKIDIPAYVKKGQAEIDRMLKAGHFELKAGEEIRWSGKWESMHRVKQRLSIVMPITLALIFILLFINFRSFGESLIVITAVPFAMVGSFVILWMLNYKLSVAVWVGIIALVGVAAENAVVMLIYLNEAYKEWRRKGKMRNLKDLNEAVFYGAVQRVRPKIMTVVTDIIALLPILLSTGTGADVMKRMAAPMVGGLVTSAILTLIIIPAIYSFYRQPGLKAAGASDNTSPGLEQPETTG